jgi:hypothetical protein
MKATEPASERDNHEADADDTVELHVRRVPRAVWQKARNNAMSSRTSFRDFIIRTLANSQPLPPEKP